MLLHFRAIIVTMDTIRAPVIMDMGYIIVIDTNVLVVVQLERFAILACVDAEVVMKRDMEVVGTELMTLMIGMKR